MALSLYALHGFLGRPCDWFFLENNLSVKLLASNIICQPDDSLWGWAKRFNDQASENNDKKILMGYSLGGRLALHALLHAPSLWKGAIIISAHYGLPFDFNVRLSRLKEDIRWAQRFAHNSWHELMALWDARSALSTSYSFSRKEQDFSRAQLSRQLMRFSLGFQDNLLPFLNHLDLPILWLAGQKDSSYSTLAEKVKLSHKASKILIAPNAGHRLPWDVQTEFKDYIKEFLENF